MADLVAHVDGGSHGNPGPAGIGVVIGPGGFGVRTEAEGRMRTVEEWESGTSGTTVIEEREGRPAR